MHAAGADHRLDEHGRHAVGADALDLRLERLERVVRHLRGVGVERADVVRLAAMPPMLVPSPCVPW